MKSITSLFYAKCFEDSHLDQFIANHNDPHMERLANWIAEKMDPTSPVWTEERRTRDVTPRQVRGGVVAVHDRTSAHVAAWNSPKRTEARAGSHFQLHDARVWMRLMFWSGRESGVFERSPSFQDWYIRFIAHFVKVYERLAPPFARESFRWSGVPENVEAYRSNGRRMDAAVVGPGGDGVPYREAASQITREERDDSEWPYYSKQGG